jgi:hypothetical protein
MPHKTTARMVENPPITGEKYLSIPNSLPSQEQLDDLLQLAKNIKLCHLQFYNLVISKDLTKLSAGAVFRMIDIASQWQVRPDKLNYLSKHLAALPDKPNFDKSLLVTKAIYSDAQAILDSFEDINYNERICEGR